MNHYWDCEIMSRARTSLLTVTLLTVIITISSPGTLSEPLSDCEANRSSHLEQPKIIPGKVKSEGTR